MLKVFSNVVSAVLLLASLAVGLLNVSQVPPVRLIGLNAFALPLGVWLLVMMAVGILCASLVLWPSIEGARQLGRKSFRRLEKAEIQAEVSSDQVQALQAKIQTLEKALENALKRLSSRT